MKPEVALFAAVKQDDVDKIELALNQRIRVGILSKSININCIDSNGNSPLHIASIHGFMNTLRFLIKRGANVEQADNNGNIPIHLAVWAGKYEPFLYFIEKYPKFLNVQNHEGSTLLHMACSNGHLDIVRSLIGKRANLEIPNFKGETAFEIACQYSKFDIIRAIVEHCKYCSAKCFYYATLKGNVDVMKLLINYVSDINIPCSKGTALHAAAGRFRLEAVQYLISEGIDPMIRDDNGMTALELVKMLIGGKPHKISSMLKEYEESLAKPVTEIIDYCVVEADLSSQSEESVTIVDSTPTQNLTDCHINGDQNIPHDLYKDLLEGESDMVFENVEYFSAADFEPIEGKSVPQIDINSFDAPSDSKEKALLKENCRLSVYFNDDWSQIDYMLSSINQSVSSYIQESETVDQTSNQRVKEWLASLDLGIYYDVFIKNGYDHMEFMSNEILSKSDINEMGISDASHIESLYSSAAKLPSALTMEPLPNSINEWLSRLCIPHYEACFLQNDCGAFDVDSLNRIGSELNFKENAFKVDKLGHRQRILASIANRDVFQILAFRSDIRKIYSTLDLSYQQDEKEESFQISNEFTEFIIQYCDKKAKEKWMYQPQLFFFSSASFVLGYLGSVLVTDCNTDVQSVKLAGCKLKASTKDIQKIPAIQMSISYNRIQLINRSCNSLICEHHVRKISCASQDEDDIKVLSYITQDRGKSGSSKYCHVFRAISKEVSTKTIFAIGQAFDLSLAISQLAKKC